MLCHQINGKHDCVLRQQLAEEYNAPIVLVNSTMTTDNNTNQLRSHAKGLLRHLKTKSLPQERVQELEATIKEFYDVEEITKELLEEASQVQAKKANKDCTGSHGEKVVMAIMEQEGHRGIVKFERRWREHFVDNMKPQYLPEGWAVDNIPESVARRMKLKEENESFLATSV